MTNLVVHITGFCESPKRIVESVLANKEAPARITFVYPGYVDDKTSMYNGFSKDRETLAERGIRIVIANHLEPTPDLLVVEAPPTAKLTLGCFETLKRLEALCTPSQTEFAVSTVKKFESFSVWYGFFIIGLMIEWFWGRIWELGKFNNYADVRARFVLRKGSRHAFFAEHTLASRIRNTHMMPTAYGGNTAIFTPHENGFEFIHWYFFTHRHFTLIGLWLMLYGAFYFWLAISWTGIAWAVWQYKNFYVFVYVASVWVAEALISSWVSSHHASIPYRVLLCCMFPFYFALFPFVMAYCRLSIPQKSWSEK